MVGKAARGADEIGAGQPHQRSERVFDVAIQPSLQPFPYQDPGPPGQQVGVDQGKPRGQRRVSGFQARNRFPLPQDASFRRQPKGSVGGFREGACALHDLAMDGGARGGP